MKNTRITITLILVFFFVLNLFAQEQFERLYRSTNWENFGLDIVQASDMGYLVLSVGKHPDSTEFQHANITKLEPKGDIQWSKNYPFEEDLFTIGELILLDNDSFVFTVLLKKEEMNKSVTKADPGGNVVWTKAVGLPNSGNPIPFFAASDGSILSTEDLGLALFDVGHNMNNGTDLFMSRLDTAGNLLWTKTYKSNSGGSPFNQSNLDAKSTLTNGFILGGMVTENMFSNALLTNLDSLGEVVWGKQYNIINIGNLASSQIRTVQPTIDSGYVAGGIYTNTSALATGWVMKTDSIGNVIWSYLINDPLTSVILNVFINNVIPKDDGSTIVLGNQVLPFTFETKSFVLKLSPSGTIDWQYYFYENPQTPSNINLWLGNQVETNDGGYAAFGYTFEDEGNNDIFIPYLLKIDQNGESSCQDTSTFQAISIPVSLDSLFFTSQTLNFIDSLDIESENYNRFSVPVLTLDAPTFCEGEPIMHTFDATVPGAVSYEWNTGDTTAMLTVTQEGMYIVEVRVEEDICYTMCDTTMITVIGPPTAEITPYFSSFCSTGQGILVAEGGSNYVWSTEETGELITIDQTGTYSVTVTNQCDSAFASVNITEFPTAPDIEIGISVDSFCSAGFYELIILGNSGGAIEWSTGETTPTIQVSEATTISAVVDFGDCGSSSDDITLSSCISEFDCVQVPNAFTPYGGGVEENNTFHPVIPPECADIQITEMKIFSRWGELVFETKDPNLRWDGNYNGEPAASDVYAYMIRLVNGNEDSTVLSGDVTLLR